MQSGIPASDELRVAFTNLLSPSSRDRGIFVAIGGSPESLVPGASIPKSSDDFKQDLANLPALLEEDTASYIVLKQNDGKCVAITYVPDKANVRQKMLFASTRLTLVRELGTEHFQSTVFATTREELTPEGWTKHEAHGSLSQPLTEEEQNLKGIKEAEALESTGTTARRGHGVGSGVSLPLSKDSDAALERLGSGVNGCVQLAIDIPSETIVLVSEHPAPVSASELRSFISEASPRYTLYSHNPSQVSSSSVLFVYTCPPGASVKERMLYASSRTGFAEAAGHSLGIEVKKKLEASTLDDVSEANLLEELQGQQAAGADPSTSSRGFARPKRPGKR